MFAGFLANAVGAESAREQIFAMDLLSLANSPFAVSFIENAVTMENISEYFKVKAIEGLERIGNVEAARAIIRLGQPSMEARVPAHIRNRLVGADCRLHERSPDPEVREVAGQLGGTTPCPEKPVISD